MCTGKKKLKRFHHMLIFLYRWKYDFLFCFVYNDKKIKFLNKFLEILK